MDLELENKETKLEGKRKRVSTIFAFINIHRIIAFRVKIWGLLMTICYFIPWFSPFKRFWDCNIEVNNSTVLNFLCHEHHQNFDKAGGSLLYKFLSASVENYHKYSSLEKMYFIRFISQKTSMVFTRLTSRYGKAAFISGGSMR